MRPPAAMAEPDIPVPDSSANRGQEEPEHEVLPAVPQPGLPVVDAIERGLATGAVAMDALASALVSSVTRQLGNENYELRREKDELREALDDRRDELEATRRCNAVMAERLDSDRGGRHLRNVGITVGTGLVSSAAFGQLRDGLTGVPILLFIGGIALIALSWFVPRQRRATESKGNKN